MSSFNLYLENELLDHIFNIGADWTPAATLYCALFISPGANDLETDPPTWTSEVANAGAYARTAVTFGSAASGGAISNTAAINFTTATANWGDITHCAIVDNSTHNSGDIYFWSPLVATRTINNGDTFSFAIGDLTITLD